MGFEHDLSDHIRVIWRLRFWRNEYEASNRDQGRHRERSECKRLPKRRRTSFAQLCQYARGKAKRQFIRRWIILKPRGCSEAIQELFRVVHGKCEFGISQTHIPLTGSGYIRAKISHPSSFRSAVCSFFLARNARTFTTMRLMPMT